MNKFKLLSNLKLAFKSAPLILLFFLTFLGTQLFNLQNLFAIFLTVMQLITVVTILFYLVNYFIARNKHNTVLMLLVVTLSVYNYGDTLISIKFDSNDSDSLTLMTWNVQRLGSLSNPLEVNANIDKVTLLLKEENIDVLILQEVSKSQVQKLAKSLNFNNKDFIWADYYGTDRKSTGGISIVLINQNWKLKSKNSLNLPPNWQSTYAEISNVKGNIFNILGIHITPPKITSNDVGNIINSSLRNKKNGYKKFKRKLVTYGKQMDLQNLQAIKISKIVEQFKDPTILAGDFNSTPEMPMHYRFRKNFNDSWIQSGNGFGHTRN